MSLFPPLSADHYHPKPMAISSITSPIGLPSETVAYHDYSSSHGCPSPSSTSSDIVAPPSSDESRSYSPPSQSFSTSSTSSESSFPSPPNVNVHRSDISSISKSNSPSYCHPYYYQSETQVSAPLSLNERRLRNKSASAKYRAKKNQQYGEMRAVISTLTKENELLLRQLNNAERENHSLKETCDHLRGKLMAQKMLKQYLKESDQETSTTDNLSCYPVLDSNSRGFTTVERKGACKQ